MSEPTPPFGYDVLPAGDPSRSRGWLPVVSVLSVLAVVAVALLLVVGRPGGGQSVADAATLVRAASVRAATAGSSDVLINMTVKAAGHTVTATGGGSFDYRRRVGQMHIDMAGLGQMQEIVTPSAMYMRLPDSMSGAMGTNGRPWLMLRFSEFKRYGVDYAKLMNESSGSDPSSMLRVLAQATQVRRTGSATINGVRTTEFSASGSLRDLVNAQGAGSGVDLSKMPAEMARTSVHYDVWLDKGGLPRRVTMKMSGGAFAGGAMDMTMDFLHYGTKVTVTVPPASLVTDMASLLKQSGG